MWKETIFKVIQMSVSHMYVSLGAGSASSVPIFRSESLTPLDRPQMGTNNVTYATFTPGAPPAAKFNIKGVDTCKRASAKARCRPAASPQGSTSLGPCMSASEQP